MERPDAIAVLEGMHQHEFGMQTLAESKGYDNVAGQYREKAEALQLAISVLKTLELNRADAKDAVKSARFCCSLISADECEDCPFFDPGDPYGMDCEFRRDQEVERLLALAYLQGGGDKEANADDEQD